MDIANVNAVFTANTAQFIASVKNASDAMQNFSTTANQTAAGVQSNLTKMDNQAKSKLGSLAKAFGIMAVGAIGAYAVKLGKDSVAAAQQAGVAQDRLRRLLLTTGGATEEQIAILNQHAKALEATTVVTGTNITTVQSQLATFDLHGSTIAKLTPAILDYVVAEKGASASAGEFKSMTNGLAQALNGNFKALTSIGFVLPETDKKLISTGTESERAAAIVRTLESTYKDFAVTGKGVQTEQVNLTKSIEQVKEALGTALLPVVQEAQGALASKLVPALKDLQERFASPQQIQKYVKVLQNLGKNLIDFVMGVYEVFKPVIQNFLLPALKVLFVAFVAIIKVLGMLGRWLKKNAEMIEIVVTVIASATIVVLAYKGAIAATTKAKKGLSDATKFLITKVKALNTAMKANPILFVVSAVIALGVAFVALWKRSEKFRGIIITVAQFVLRAFAKMARAIKPFAEGIANLITGPIRAFLWVMSKIPIVGSMFGTALDFLNNGIAGLEETLESGAVQLEKWADSLDKYRKIPKGSFGIEEAAGANTDPKSLFPDLSKLGEAWNTGAGDAADSMKKGTKKIQGGLDNLRKLLQEFADYMANEFGQKMLQGADAARDAIGKALDLLSRIIEEKAKDLSGKALKKLQQSFYEVEDSIRALIPQAEQLSEAYKILSEDLVQAENQLNQALEARASAVAKFNEMFREPFGEPSELKRTLSNMEASVDSIISTYDKLVETVRERYAGIDPTGRDQLIDFLTDQTAALVDLARKRMEAVKVLEESQQALDDVMSQQRAFQSDLSSSIRNFGLALADVSQADSEAVIQVIKGASGLVITQIRESSSGVDKITKQLQDRLKLIKEFTANIRTLLSRGLNKDYVRQLLEAGPEAAALTAQTLAMAGDSQISEINSLYGEINKMSESFGTEMATSFYQNAVDMATAFRDGAAAEVESLTAQMVAIRVSIENALEPLRDMGADLGTDLMQGLVEAIQAEKNRVLAEIQALIAEIARLMELAQQAAGLRAGVGRGGFSGGVGGAPGGGPGMVIYSSDGASAMGFGGTTMSSATRTFTEADRVAAIKNVTDLRRQFDTTTAAGAKAFAESPIAQAAVAWLDTVKSGVGLRTSAEDLAALNSITGGSRTKQLNEVSRNYFNTIDYGAVQININGDTNGITPQTIEEAVMSGVMSALDGRRTVAS